MNPFHLFAYYVLGYFICVAILYIDEPKEQRKRMTRLLFRLSLVWPFLLAAVIAHLIVSLILKAEYLYKWLITKGGEG